MPAAKSKVRIPTAAGAAYRSRVLSLPKPDVILTHESDLDGLVAGVLLQRLAQTMFATPVSLQAWNYQGWKNRSMQERAAWVTDFTFETRLDREGWLVVDHHATNVAPKQAKFVHDLTKSAAQLTYDLCREQGLESPELTRLVHLTNVGDLWLHTDPDFDLACDFANLVKTYGFWHLHDLLEGRIELLLNHPLLEVMAVKRRVEDPIGFEWSRQNVREISKTVGLVQTTIGNTNLIVHQLLARQATPYKVLVTLFPKANRTVVASFRSQNGEALPVAAKLQGGGHANAAGTTLPKSVTDVDTAIGYLRQALNGRFDTGTTGAPAQGASAFNTPFAGLKL